MGPQHLKQKTAVLFSLKAKKEVVSGLARLPLKLCPSEASKEPARRHFKNHNQCPLHIPCLYDWSPLAIAQLVYFSIFDLSHELGTVVWDTYGFAAGDGRVRASVLCGVDWWNMWLPEPPWAYRTSQPRGFPCGPVMRSRQYDPMCHLPPRSAFEVFVMGLFFSSSCFIRD